MATSMSELISVLNEKKRCYYAHPAKNGLVVPTITKDGMVCIFVHMTTAGEHILFRMPLLTAKNPPVRFAEKLLEINYKSSAGSFTLSQKGEVTVERSIRVGSGPLSADQVESTIAALLSFASEHCGKLRTMLLTGRDEYVLSPEQETVVKKLLGQCSEPAGARRISTGTSGEQESIGEFLATASEPHSAATLPVKVLYEDYCRWCQQQGQSPLGKMHFNEVLRSKHGLSSTIATGGMVWIGIRLRKSHQIKQ